MTMVLSLEVREFITRRRERRRQRFEAMLRRFARERPNENPRRLIADQEGMSYATVCDVLAGRR